MATNDRAIFAEPNAYSDLEKAITYFRWDENGYAVPNRFEVLIFSPSANSAEAQKVSLRCESISIPGRNLNTLTDSNTYGPTREIVDGVTYAEDITITFQASAGLDERRFFEEWQEQAFNEHTWNIGYYNDYVSTVEIYLLDRGGQPAVARQPSTIPGSGGKKAPPRQESSRYGIRLVEAFPKTINAIDLSQATNNEIIKTSVSFSFRYWQSLRIDKQARSLIGDDFDLNANTVQRNINRNIPAAVLLERQAFRLWTGLD